MRDTDSLILDRASDGSWTINAMPAAPTEACRHIATFTTTEDMLNGLAAILESPASPNRP